MSARDTGVAVDASDLVDLHLHTRAYDGFWTPESLVAEAIARGLKVIAVTDHDTLISVEPTRSLAQQWGVACIPAVEVTSEFAGEIYHLLLYGVERNDGVLSRMLADVRQQQKNAAEQGLARLREQGINLEHLPVIVAERDLMPFYIVVALLRGGHARDMDAAVELGESVGINFRLASRLEDVLAAARDGGFVSVLAHPGRAEMGLKPPSDCALDSMVAAGLDGLEAYHALHSPQDVARLAEFARSRGLLLSCGSDSHGPQARTLPAGWPARLCAPLLRRCGIGVTGLEAI